MSQGLTVSLGSRRHGAYRLMDVNVCLLVGGLVSVKLLCSVTGIISHDRESQGGWTQGNPCLLGSVLTCPAKEHLSMWTPCPRAPELDLSPQGLAEPRSGTRENLSCWAASPAL